ncbi:MAG: DUF4446 family protein [Actinobacteria bacterium]|nr:DUF4446 family protein [Actinomycetota bacterium]MSW36553.1 DUF4446 family protein [Actinomycetota bacterium]MSX38983.1 DUF4446 family protein [Actinomycetota bacterium]
MSRERFTWPLWGHLCGGPPGSHPARRAAACDGRARGGPCADTLGRVSLDPSSRDVLVVIACGIALVALVLGALALFLLRRIRRNLTLLAANDDGESFISAVGRGAEQVRGLRREVDDLAALVAQTRAELSDAIRHISVVRYDAFGDLGGRLSFSAALLDDDGDGLVLTAIHGRSETRSYMKGIKSGASEAPLSPEEQQAVTYALKGASS